MIRNILPHSSFPSSYWETQTCPPASGDGRQCPGPGAGSRPGIFHTAKLTKTTKMLRPPIGAKKSICRLTQILREICIERHWALQHRAERFPAARAEGLTERILMAAFSNLRGKTFTGGRREFTGHVGVRASHVRLFALTVGLQLTDGHGLA